MDTAINMEKYYFMNTELWQRCFVRPLDGINKLEISRLETALLIIRKRALSISSLIQGDLKQYTPHDITHLDDLWECISKVMHEEISINPLEGFILGCVIYIHDLALTANFYSSKAEIEAEELYQNFLAYYKRNEYELPEEHAINDFLRANHAIKIVDWHTFMYRADNRPFFLLEDSELLIDYGRIIGHIAASHGRGLQDVEQMFYGKSTGGYGEHDWKIDPLKLALLFRIGDFIHIDSRRAPQLLQHLYRITNRVSQLHWTFQKLLLKPSIENKRLRFTSKRAFQAHEKDAWWLCHHVLQEIDTEIRAVNRLRERSLSVEGIDGIDNTEQIVRFIEVEGWLPIDCSLKASDIPNIIEKLGGSTLYGNDYLAPLRELIQNAVDAINARKEVDRKMPSGKIEITLKDRDQNYYLEIVDNGIGMSDFVVKNYLLNFGSSFWASRDVVYHLKSLNKFKPIGRFGIGFFSVFMLGKNVKVVTLKYNQGRDSALTLEFSSGLSHQPTLRAATIEEQDLVAFGGTAIIVEIKDYTQFNKNVLTEWIDEYQGKSITLGERLAHYCPTLEVDLFVDGTRVVGADDWKTLSFQDTLKRLMLPNEYDEFYNRWQYYIKSAEARFTSLQDENGLVLGRGVLLFLHDEGIPEYAGGIITVGGVRTTSLGIPAILVGKASTVDRKNGIPLVEERVFSQWCLDQFNSIDINEIDDEDIYRYFNFILPFIKDFPSEYIMGIFGHLWFNNSEYDDIISTFCSDRVVIIDDEYRQQSNAFNFPSLIGSIFIENDPDLAHTAQNQEWYKADPKRTHSTDEHFLSKLAGSWGFEVHEIKAYHKFISDQVRVIRPDFNNDYFGFYLLHRQNITDFINGTLLTSQAVEQYINEYNVIFNIRDKVDYD